MTVTSDRTAFLPPFSGSPRARKVDPRRCPPRGGSASASDWLLWVSVATPAGADWLYGLCSARRRPRPLRVFVVGLRSRGSRRKRQDNGDPGRRVRLPIQRYGRWGTNAGGDGGDAADRRAEVVSRPLGRGRSPGLEPYWATSREGLSRLVSISFGLGVRPCGPGGPEGPEVPWLLRYRARAQRGWGPER